MREIAMLIKELNDQGIGLKVIDDNLEVSLFKDDIDESVFDQIRANKPELLDYLNSLAGDFNYTPIPKAPLANSYPLSAAQRGMWLSNKLEIDPTTYNLSGRITLPKDTNIEHFKNAVVSTIQRHEILRTVFIEDASSGVRQVIESPSNLNMEINLHDFRNKSEGLELFLIEEQNKAFDLEKGPLLRTNLVQVENDQYIFSYNIHHIISDGWSNEIMSRDVFDFYQANVHNQDPTLSDLDIQYKDYAVWQNSQAGETAYRLHQKFWMEKLHGSLPRIDFTEANNRPKIRSSRGRLLSTTIDSTTTQKLKQYVEMHGGTLFMGLLAVLKVLVYRYTDIKDIIVATPTAGREHPQLKDQIGFYVNTLALRDKLDTNDTFDELFKRIKENTLDSFEHQSYPFDKVVEDLKIEKDASRSSIFDLMLTFQNVANEIDETDAIESASNEIQDRGYCPSKFDIELELQEIGRFLSFDFVYNTDLFENEFIEQFIKHYKSLMNALIDQPSATLGSVEFLTEDDEHQLNNSYNRAQVERASGKNVLDVFSEVVSRTPDAFALTYANDDIQEKTLTYKELDERSNQLCHYLHETYDLKPENRISIKQPVSDSMFVSILAVLKAGCAYVPIDLDYPQQRIEHIERDANCAICLDENELRVFHEKATNFSKDRRDIEINETDLAYVIYTSGSTGNPKGVMVEHRNLYHSTRSRIDLYPNPQGFLLMSSVAFDSSLAGIFGTLLAGGRLVVTPTINAGNFERIVDLIEHTEITQLLTVPSLYKLLLSRLSGKVNKLKIATVAGENCPEQLVQMHFEMPEMHDCELYNEYGPTECTVWSTFKKYQRDAPFLPSIGKPIDNTKIVVVNESLKLQPIGVAGEICIAGTGVARGYLNEPELTQLKFVESNTAKPYDRMYRTGDLGKWTRNGELVFLGRMDDQVKIRGYRIQLEEVERALSGLSTIDQAAVITEESKDGEWQMCAYLVGNESMNSNDISEQLKQVLPAYMIPSKFMQIDEIPLTSNGKMDKLALTNLEGKQLSMGDTYIAPRNAIEKRLVEMWEEILERQDIGVRDDFFSLGGHSLTVIRLISKIQAEYDSKFEVAKLFEQNTIEKIAELITIVPNFMNESDEDMETFKV